MVFLLVLLRLGIVALLVIWLGRLALRSISLMRMSPKTKQRGSKRTEKANPKSSSTPDAKPGSLTGGARTGDDTQ